MDYTLKISPRMLELLSKDLYTNLYFVLAELIANAYDADAENVYVCIDENEIRVEDDGVGMSPNILNDVYLYVGSATSHKKGAVSITVESMGDTSSSIVSSFNTITSTKEPTISREYDTFNYFVYNGRNYFYNLNPGGIFFTTKINDNYLYWVMVADYSNLTKEDIESILYFEVV